MDYVGIQKKLDYGRGKEASKLGAPYDAYRVSSASSGNVIQDSNKIVSGVRIYTKVDSGSAKETSHQLGIMWYQIIADMSPFLVGDVFVLNDPVYGAGYSSVPFTTKEFNGFALADHSPIKKSLGGRLNINIQILRLNVATTAQGQWDKTLNSAQPVVLKNGLFGIGDVGQTGAWIPAGLMATKTDRDKAFDQVPAQQRKSSWELYLPALNGFDIREGDRIVDANGARYIVIVPYTQHVGASGSQWTLEREVSKG